MGWMKSGSTRWAGHPSPSRLFPVTPWRKLDVRVQETLLCRYRLHRRCTLWLVSFGGSALLKPGAQVDVDGVLQRHSTLRSWACGENVCGLAFFQG